jgi:hypothetical protein
MIYHENLYGTSDNALRHDLGRLSIGGGVGGSRNLGGEAVGNGDRASEVGTMAVAV